MRRPRPPAVPAATLVLLLGLGLGACGTAEPACAATGEDPAAVPGPSSNADPELRDRFPDTIGGDPLEIQTVCATQLGSGGLTTDPAFLQALGVGLEDVTIAIGPPPSIGEADGHVGIMAWRYRGAEEASIRETFLDGLRNAGVDPTDAEAGGKPVHEAFGGYYYVAGDTLYSITGDLTQAGEVMEALP